MVSVLISVWNQGKIVTGNFKRLVQVLESEAEKYEVIMIDDGSDDDTLSQLAGLQEGSIKIIRLNHTGQHKALFEGFKIASGDLVLTVDADQKVGPEYIPQILRALRGGADIAVAWRQKRPGLGIIRKAGSYIINSWTNFVTNTRLHDHACSLKGFRRDFLIENMDRPELKDFFAILSIKYAKNISEIKAECSYKKEKDSALGLFKLGVLFFDFFLKSAGLLVKRAY